MTVTSFAVVTTMFLFGMGDCTVDSDIGMSNLSLVLGILHKGGHVHAQSHVSPSME